MPACIYGIVVVFALFAGASSCFDLDPVSPCHINDVVYEHIPFVYVLIKENKFCCKTHIIIVAWPQQIVTSKLKYLLRCYM